MITFQDRPFDPTQPVTMDNHLAFDEFDHDDETALPCVCWEAGREGRDAWQGMQHPSEYAKGLEGLYEYENDV